MDGEGEVSLPLLPPFILAKTTTASILRSLNKDGYYFRMLSCHFQDHHNFIRKGRVATTGYEDFSLLLMNATLIMKLQKGRGSFISWKEQYGENKILADIWEEYVSCNRTQ